MLVLFGQIGLMKSMKKHWSEKLNKYYPDYEYLRVKKIGNNYFAYARHSEWGGQKERYLGRCDKDGNIVSKRRKIRRKKNK